MPILSETGLHIKAATDGDLLTEGFEKVTLNRYDKHTNPKGIINLGTSENKLMSDVLSKKFSEPELNVWTEEMLVYCDFAAIYELRESIAGFLTAKSNASTPLDPNKMAVMNGCGSVIETIAFAICNPGDAFMTPSPFYGSLMHDLDLRAKVKIHPVHLNSKQKENETKPFQLTVEKLEKGLEEAKSKGINIRGLFLINPHNPLGEIYSTELIIDCLQFCHTHSIHIIFDEIYQTSVFIDGVQPTSILQFKPEDIPDPDRTHLIWGFSKDFAMSGMRAGIYYGFSDVVRQQIVNQCCFTGIPAFIQVMLSKMLKDKDWLDDVYYATNRKRLRESYELVTRELTSIGVPYLEASSSLYLYADFRKFLKEPTFAMEKDMWHKFLDAGIYISPSQAFYSDDPGWFRIVFADKIEKLELGMERIKKVCKETSLD